MTRTSKSWNRKLANAQAVRFLTDFFDLKSIKFLPYDILSKKAWLFTLFHNIQLDCLLEGFVRITVARHGFNYTSHTKWAQKNRDKTLFYYLEVGDVIPFNKWPVTASLSFSCFWCSALYFTVYVWDCLSNLISQSLMSSFSR